MISESKCAETVRQECVSLLALERSLVVEFCIIWKNHVFFYLKKGKKVIDVIQEEINKNTMIGASCGVVVKPRGFDT